MRMINCFETADMPAAIAKAASDVLSGQDTEVFFVHDPSIDPAEEASALDRWLISDGATPGEKVIIERGHW